MRTILGVVLLGSGALMFDPAAAYPQVSYDACFMECHSAAMHVYENYGPNAASVYFDGCMTYRCHRPT